MQFKDYYAVLGVPRDATEAQVKKAFRQLARKYHPDVSKEADAAARMSEVNEAYAVLSDAERRAAYDGLAAGRHQGEAFTPPPDWDAGFEFSGAGFGDAADHSDFFEMLFGRAGMGRRPGARAAGGRLRGEDHHARIVLDLEDAFRGGVRQVSLRHPQPGPDGRVRLVERTLELRIPRGLPAGRLIRLEGQGSPGVGGAPAGDLLLEVGYRPHPRFRLDGANLLADLPVAPWEAALGGVVPVALPDGSTLKVRVPAGAQGGRLLTVRGKGLPDKVPGDLELTVRVVLPSAHDPRVRALYERMATELPDFDARRVAAGEAERGEHA